MGAAASTGQWGSDVQTGEQTGERNAQSDRKSGSSTWEVPPSCDSLHLHVSASDCQIRKICQSEPIETAGRHDLAVARIVCGQLWTLWRQRFIRQARGRRLAGPPCGWNGAVHSRCRPAPHAGRRLVVVRPGQGEPTSIVRRSFSALPRRCRCRPSRTSRAGGLSRRTSCRRPALPRIGRRPG